MPNKSAKVESKRASANFDKGFIPYKNTKRNQNKFKSAVKTVNIFVALLIFIITAGIGVGAYFVVCKNDCFTLNGAQEISITMQANTDNTGFVGAFTDDLGVKIIEFGKDISSEVIIETDMKKVGENEYEVNELGTYYIKYSVNSIKYGKIFTINKIRLVNFVEPSENIVVD